MSKKKTPPIFYLVLVLIPVLFFVLLEAGLRAADYGRSYELFTKVENTPPGMIYLNPEMSYKYFGQLKNPVFDQAIGIRETKPANGFRVFVFGGSSAQGFPYASRASFPSHLERMLKLAYPEKIIEVVNLGTSAINSHTLLDILPDVLSYSPDLILMYAGHNEYYGALGPASTRLGNPRFVRLLLKLREYRLVQLIQNILSPSASSTAENKNLMQDMIGQSSIELGGEIYQQGIYQFDKNLTDFIELTREADIPLVIGTLSSNLKNHKPFNAQQQDENGLTSEMHFKLGHEQLENGNINQAKFHFIQAKELDGLRFRAPSEINSIIRAKAVHYEVPLVDVDSIFHQTSPDSITGDSLMCDHLHPSREGYFLMAKLYAERLKQNSLLPEGQVSGWPSDSTLLANFPYSALDSIVDRRLLLTGLGQYPFVPLGAPNPYADEIGNDDLRYELTAQSQVDSIRTLVALDNLEEGDTLGFKKEIDVMLSYLPLNERPYMSTVRKLDDAGLLGEAYPLFESKLRQLDPGRSRHKILGLYFMTSQKFDSAVFHLESALELAESDDLLRLTLGKAYGNQGMFDKAIDQFTQVIKLDPENKDAYSLRGSANFELKRYQDTERDMTEVIRLSEETDQTAFLLRGLSRTWQNNVKGACEDWNSAKQLGSTQAAALVQQYCQ